MCMFALCYNIYIKLHDDATPIFKRIWFQIILNETLSGILHQFIILLAIFYYLPYVLGKAVDKLAGISL